ncbi:MULTISPECIES: hypothetical protein [unclassified Microbacterium]|uniref:hypothetical protein n=1 Tax=unclassified Microbacterium TaxID=2609290 RepID=UPI003017CCE6
MGDEIVEQARSEADEIVSGGDVPTTALVEFEDGLAVLFGDRVPEGIDLIPFAFLDPVTRTAVSTAAGTAVGLGNMAAQGVNAAMQAQGLVRLAPQTLAALKTAAPIVKDGWNLGTLAAGGKFAAQVRWLPATAATTASVVAAMGPAVALMVIQVQLNQIARVAEHNLELTSKVLQVVRQDQWSSVSGYHNTLLRELGHARKIGVVTDAIFGEVRGYQGELSAQWDIFEKAVRQHVVELHGKVGHKERQQYLTDNGQAIIADVQALLLAQTSWFVYQALRAGHLLASAASDQQDAELLKTLVANAQTLHEQTLTDTDWLLDQLAREFAIIDELPGKRTFKIGGTARAAKDATQMVRQLRAVLAEIRGHEAPSEPEPLRVPAIAVFEKDVPDELMRILPLRLESGEQVLALADASCDRWNVPMLGAGWVAVTDRRILVTKQDSLRRVGAIDIELDVDDIRYVRMPDRIDKPLVVDVVTRTADLTLQFPGWSKSGEARTEAERMGELVASFMHLPGAEVPARPAVLDTGESRGALTDGAAQSRR